MNAADLADLILPLLFWIGIGFCGVVGLLALVHPRLLASANSHSSRWIDSARLFALLDKQIHVDQFVLKHNRIFGTLSLLTAAGLVFWYLHA